MDNSCTTSNAMLALRKSWLGIRLAPWTRGCVVVALLSAVGTAASAVELADVQEEYAAGDYVAAIKHAEKGVADAPGNEDWHLVYTQALLAVGRYADADAAITAGTNLLPQSLRLRWLAREAATANGHPERAATLTESIGRLYGARPWAYRTAPELVVFGRAALVLGADPKDVLDRVFAVAQKAAPKLRDVYLARGEVALEKHDFALAATVFEEGLKQLPDDPELNYGLARAHVEGDRPTMISALEAALKKNSHHVPSLLLLADHRVDEENYPEAEKLLRDVLAINPNQPDAWALNAVLAHLRNDRAGEESARASALRSWAKNPRVDWLIGQKLSQKYRFTEGAARQQQALRFDPDYLPAKAQLASDLLRLGRENDGWKLAEAVHHQDAYDVEAYNLATLHDTMAKYATLTTDDFVVRMTSPEAAIYGQQVLDLLARAKQQLTKKYGIELAQPTFVEIFADPKDFAVRTFGMPDVSGFLGVCFGQVVTANSPASTAAHGTNWESVLWHEFCHVVTLQLTANKMPRWLSEGISVYEERQANPSWGQHMIPRYREMILGKELTPVGEMSAAFLAPKTPLHLQFAYYQASLVAEYLVTRHGPDKLRALLQELRNGTAINAALAQHIAPLATLEKEFTAFARERAEQLGAGLEWEKPAPKLLRPDAADELAKWSEKHPNNYWVLLQKARTLIAEKKWADAKAPLERLLASYPDQRGPDSALRLLAAVQRGLGDAAAERVTLEKMAILDDEAPDAYLRAIELASDAKDWSAVALNTRRFLEINPLIASPYRALAQANAELGNTSGAIAANRTLLLLDPQNPAEVHFQLAELLHRQGNNEARRQVLMALEDAPRNRAALNLLLSLDANRATREASPASSTSASTPLVP
jgi:Tfp pilus assembly protein PilF